MSKFLSKQDILAANDLKRVEVDVPEWGGKVWVTSFPLMLKMPLNLIS